MGEPGGALATVKFATGAWSGVTAPSMPKPCGELSAIGSPDSVLAGVETICTELPNDGPPPASATRRRAPSGVIASPPGLNGCPRGVTTAAKLIGVPAVLVAVLIGVTTCLSQLAAYSVAPLGLITTRPGSPK